MRHIKSLLTIAIIALCVQTSQAQDFLNWALTVGDMTNETANDMVVDSDENIYILGQLHGPVNMNPSGNYLIFPSGNNRGIYVAKYDKNGAIVWAIALDANNATDIMLSDSGSVLIAGTFRDTANFGTTILRNNVNSTASTIFIASFNKDSGAFQGAAAMEGSGDQQPLDLKANGSSIILAGSFKGTADFDTSIGQANRTQVGSVQDLFVTEFSDQGALNWVKTIGVNSANTTIDEIEADASGNVYAVGRLWESPDFQNSTSHTGGTGVRPESFIVKYATDGSYVWHQQGSHAGSIDRSGYFSLEIDDQGDLSIVGFVQGTVTLGGFSTTTSGVDGSPNILVVKYAPDGTAISAHVLGGDDIQFGLSHVLDDQGNYIIIGAASGPGNDFDPDPNGVFALPLSTNNQNDIFIAKYDDDLSFQWAGAFIGSSINDLANTVATSSEGNIYVSGYVEEDVDFDFDPVNVSKNGLNGARDLFIASLKNITVVNQNINLCFGTTVQVGNSSYDAVGSYQNTFTGGNSMGQDSIVNTTILSLLGEITLSAAPLSPTCFGNDDGSVTITASDAATRNYQYSINGVTSQSSPTFTDLVAGTYTVFVQDQDDCVSSINFQVQSTPELTATLGITNPLCHGTPGGIISVSATGGTGTYTYSIDGINFQTSAAFVEISAGQYTINIKDSNDCIVSVTATVTEPALLSALVDTQFDPLCNGLATGFIEAAALGGVSPYSYSLNGSTFQSSPRFENLAAGQYSITVKDANNCTQTSSAINLSEPDALVLNYEQVNVTCNGANNGQIDGAASGGVGPYTYSLDGTNFQTAIFDELAPGDYTLTVKDANNCTTATNIIITEPLELVLSPQKTDVTCHGEDDGTITLFASGGNTGGGTIFINNEVTTSSSFTGLAPGTYDFRILDVNMCEATATVTINEPDVLTVTATTTNVSCNAADDGQIALTGVGGTGPYEYAIDGTNFQSAASFGSLVPENYTITMRDVNGCVATATATITEPNALIVAVTLTNFNTITATALGGTAPYEYSLGSTFQSSGTFSNLGNGNYTVTARDANGCTVSAPQALIITGVDEPAFSPTVRSYPNPAQDYLVVSEVVKGDVISMVSISGKTINQNTIIKSQTNYRQDISTMERTLFVLLITDESGRIKLRQKVMRVN